ncbi:MAG: hypothetical protein IJH63_10540 [Methanobrevibacter sp.]|nr:hypothetical protein [Methanosphaera sp.]MBR0371138.1 hypothetical protein [Methanobrevibacter sp.]
MSKDDKLNELTKDLQNGYTLDEALTRNNTNLREVFRNINRYPATRRKYEPEAEVKDEWRYIQPTKSYTYRVRKRVNDTHINFGTYKTFEDAKLVRDYLEENNWDIRLLDDFIMENNIPRQKRRLK